MAFADNQQDSSFQAAYLQSLSRRFHLRRAIMQGLADIGATTPSAAAPTSDVADAAFAAMERTQTLPAFTCQTEAKIVILPAGELTVIGWRGLCWSWRWARRTPGSARFR